jgi:CubicO group peptidase (beta-lactamase class C family)
VTLDQTIDTVISAAVRGNVIPGAVAAVVDNEGLRSIRSYGVRSEVSGDPMTDDTVFQIASMTKPITGVACMQAVERGLLALDQPAGDVIPWLADVQVIDRFDESGPVTPAAGKVTCIRLLFMLCSALINSELRDAIEVIGAASCDSAW